MYNKNNFKKHTDIEYQRGWEKLEEGVRDNIERELIKKTADSLTLVSNCTH